LKKKTQIRDLLTGLPYSGKSDYFKKLEHHLIDMIDINDREKWNNANHGCKRNRE